MFDPKSIKSRRGRPAMFDYSKLEKPGDFVKLEFIDKKEMSQKCGNICSTGKRKGLKLFYKSEASAGKFVAYIYNM